MSLVAHPVLATVLALWAGPYLNDAHGLGGVARGNVLLVMATAMIVGSLCYGPLDRLFDTGKRIVVGAALANVAVLGVLALTPGRLCGRWCCCSPCAASSALTPWW